MAVSDAETDSDYGYDFSPEEELELIRLAAQASGSLSRGPGAATPPAAVDSGADVRREAASLGPVPEPGRRLPPSEASVREDVDYPDLSRALSEIRDGGPPPRQPPPANDERSPLQRFRSFPRKPLSVSDLTSGAWCELQYWYTLTRLPGGRRTRTPAMRQGSRVHRKLEDEVHTRVKVEVMTKEDGFALRLWNFVQGMRTLRETGLTRELEVWGMVDGNLVNGVIDGVSHENPNPEFEEELSSQEAEKGPAQSTLTDYFPPKTRSRHVPAAPKIYLCDVKTRGSTVPVSSALLRPAKIQLLLYHRLLADMASEQLDFLALLGRYGLDPDRVLSDTFLAQIGALHEEVFYDGPSSPVEREDEEGQRQGGDGGEADAGAEAEDSADELVRYRSLRELWSLVLQEIGLTFPEGRDSLGHMLRVQYVYRADGHELDVHDFPVSKQALDAYLAGYMGWWRGEREARGVDIEEAFKCRSCDFAADCAWRQSMDEERVQGAQRKMRAASQSRGRKK